MPIPISLRAAHVFALCNGLLAVSATGCSFAFVDGPPAAHRQLPYFVCTQSNVLPTIDLALGGLAAIQAVSQYPSSSSSTSYSTGSKEEAYIAAGEAAIFAASAIYGYSKTASCREATGEMIKRMPPAPAFAPAPAAPYGYPPPAQYDPWVTPRPSSFSAPPPAPPPGGAAPTPAPGAPLPMPPARDGEEPRK
jgi:hypothetical protein